MKYTAVFVILSCLFASAICASERVTTWGNVNGKEVGSENVVVPSTILKVKTYEFTFPKVPLIVPIIGIKHTDHKSHPVKVDIINGGIGQKTVRIRVTSQRGHGINSRFTFYALV